MVIASLLLKAVIGGVLVVLFSCVGESIKPRRLAGIASAAPSIALASLAITLVVSGGASARNLRFAFGAAVSAMASRVGRSSPAWVRGSVSAWRSTDSRWFLCGRPAADAEGVLTLIYEDYQIV